MILTNTIANEKLNDNMVKNVYPENLFEISWIAKNV